MSKAFLSTLPGEFPQPQANFGPEARVMTEVKAFLCKHPFRPQSQMGTALCFSKNFPLALPLNHLSPFS